MLHFDKISRSSCVALPARLPFYECVGRITGSVRQLAEKNYILDGSKTFSPEEMGAALWEIKGRLSAKARYLVGSTGIDAEDLLMETFASCIKSRSGFEAGTNLYGWAVQNMKWRFQDLRRKGGDDTLPLDETDYEWVGDPGAGDSDGIITIQECLDKIKPPEKRDILFEYLVLGLKAREIAEKRGKNTNTVLTWISQKREELADCIQGAYA